MRHMKNQYNERRRPANNPVVGSPIHHGESFDPDVTISSDTYRKLVEAATRLDILSAVVARETSKYISIEDIAIIIGLQLKDVEEHA